MSLNTLNTVNTPIPVIPVIPVIPPSQVSRVSHLSPPSLIIYGQFMAICVFQLTIRNRTFFEQTVPHFRFGPEKHPEFVHFSRKKNFFFKSVPLFPFFQNFHLQSVTLKAEHTEHGEHTDYVITLIPAIPVIPVIPLSQVSQYSQAQPHCALCTMHCALEKLSPLLSPLTTNDQRLKTKN